MRLSTKPNSLKQNAGAAKPMRGRSSNNIAALIDDLVRARAYGCCGAEYENGTELPKIQFFKTCAIVMSNEGREF